MLQLIVKIRRSPFMSVSLCIAIVVHIVVLLWHYTASAPVTWGTRSEGGGLGVFVVRDPNGKLHFRPRGRLPSDKLLGDIDIRVTVMYSDWQTLQGRSSPLQFSTMSVCHAEILDETSNTVNETFEVSPVWMDKIREAVDDDRTRYYLSLAILQSGVNRTFWPGVFYLLSGVAPLFTWGALMIVAGAAFVRNRRRRARVNRRLCIECGYPLVEEGCPECGSKSSR